MNTKKTLIVSASGTAQFGKTLSRALDIPWVEIESSKFPNEELRLRLQNVGETTILLGSLSKPVNNRVIEYILAADALKRLGCQNIIGVLSWYAYSKQDKVFLEGEPLSAKVIANMLQTDLIQELYTLDLHNPAICDYFNIPITNMTATDLFVEHFKKIDLHNTVVVSPDTGSINKSTTFANLLNLPIIHAFKSRDLISGKVTYTGLDDDIDGQNILIFDDLIATGSTLVEIGEFLHNKTAKNITVCCTHHLYVNEAQQKLDNSYINEIIVTNSILPNNPPTSPKLKVVDIAPILIKHLSKNKSIKP